MRLELGSDVASFQSVRAGADPQVGVVNAAEVDRLLKQGVSAAQNGDRALARTLLTQVTEADPQSANAWLWLASISEYPEELLGFLNNVLDIDPENERARQWEAATRSLLAKNFVQRGIAAKSEFRPDLAMQCFENALEYDSKCEMAWFWKASLLESDADRTECLEAVLAINPDNHEARNTMEAIRKHRAAAILDSARSAAVASERAKAYDLIDQVLELDSSSVDAWKLLSQVVTSFQEKLAAMDRVLALDPDDDFAIASHQYLVSTVESVKPAAVAEDRRHQDDNEFAVDDSANQAAYSDPTVDVVEQDNEHLSVPVVEEDPGEQFSWPASDAFASAESAMMEQASDADVSDEVVSDAIRQTATNIHEYLTEESYRLPDVSDNGETERLDQQYEPVERSPEVENHEAASFVHVHDVEAAAEEFGASDEGQSTYQFADEKNDHADEVNFSEPVDDHPYSSDMTALAAELDRVEQELSKHEPEVSNEEAPAAVDPFTALAPNEPASAGEDLGFDHVRSPDFEPALADTDPKIELPPVEYLETAQEPAHVSSFESGETGHSVSEHPVGSTCPYCDAPGDPQAFQCISCRAVLSLSDIEALLANQPLNVDVIHQSVMKMEGEWNQRDFDEHELTVLGIGHFNLRNYDRGLAYLREASRSEPNNVILAAQVNSLAIRLDEMTRRAENLDSMPKGKTILVVDDSATVRKLISSKLEKCGHNVLCAVDGVDAIEMIEGTVPDLVLLDIAMPRMDGYQVCKAIRLNPASKHVPVVMISGKDGFFDKVRGRMAGTTGYITKPFGPETLMKALETYLVSDVSPAE